MSTTDSGESRVRELERRIRDLDTQDDDSFGRFTAWDWVAVTVFCVLVPIALFWWSA